MVTSIPFATTRKVEEDARVYEYTSAANPIIAPVPHLALAAANHEQGTHLHLFVCAVAKDKCRSKKTRRGFLFLPLQLEQGRWSFPTETVCHSLLLFLSVPGGFWH